MHSDGAILNSSRCKTPSSCVGDFYGVNKWSVMGRRLGVLLCISRLDFLSRLHLRLCLIPGEEITPPPAPHTHTCRTQTRPFRPVNAASGPLKRLKRCWSGAESNGGSGPGTSGVLPVSLPAFDFLDLAGAEDQHAVLEAAHLTRGCRPQTGGRRLLVPGWTRWQKLEPIRGVFLPNANPGRSSRVTAGLTFHFSASSSSLGPAEKQHFDMKLQHLYSSNKNS